MDAYLQNISVVSKKEMQQYYPQKGSTYKHFFFFDTEKEMNNQRRFLGFTKKDKEIEKIFNGLPVSEQRKVIHTILQLSDYKECFGYNLKQCIDGVCNIIKEKDYLNIKKNKYLNIKEKKSKDQRKKSKDQNISHRAIYRALHENRLCFNLNINDDSADYTNCDNIAKRFNKYFNQNGLAIDKRTDYQKLIELLCVFLGFSIDVLLYGRGECYLTDAVSMSGFDYWDILYASWEKVTHKCEAIKDVSVKQIYEDTKMPFTTNYVVLKYSGCYQYLKNGKGKENESLKSINQLIKDLAKETDMRITDKFIQYIKSKGYRMNLL